MRLPSFGLALWRASTPAAFARARRVRVPLLAAANGVAAPYRRRACCKQRGEAAVSPLLRPESGTKTRPRPSRSRAPSRYAHSNRSEASSRFFTPKNGGEKGGGDEKWPVLPFTSKWQALRALWKISLITHHSSLITHHSSFITSKWQALRPPDLSDKVFVKKTGTAIAHHCAMNTYF